MPSLIGSAFGSPVTFSKGRTATDSKALSPTEAGRRLLNHRTSAATKARAKAPAPHKTPFGMPFLITFESG